MINTEHKTDFKEISAKSLSKSHKYNFALDRKKTETIKI